MFLFLPLIFQFVELKKFAPLNGVQEDKVQQLVDSLNNKISWFNGSFQRYCDLNSSQNLNLKSAYIRLKNKLQYNLFDKINAKEVYEYKGILFRFYQDDYNEGVNFMGEEKAREKVNKLNEIQKYLGDDIPIITLIAPSKTYFYAEKLPRINTIQTPKSNYKFIKKLVIEKKLHCIDFNTHFLKQKKSKTPIFGKVGIHWTSYAATLAMDSVVNYLSEIKNQEFQHPSWEFVPFFYLEYDDHDLAYLLNVFNPPIDLEVKTMKFHKLYSPKKKIKALIISDSFFDVISKTGLRNQIFTKDSEYLYYFSTKKEINDRSKEFDKSKLLSKIRTFDCVIILNDIVNMENFSWGFIDELYTQIQADK